MPELSGFGRLLIFMGVALVVLGALLEAMGRGWLFGLGRLPGDIYIRRGNFQFYAPLATSLLLSLILTLILGLIRR